jgi:hypothetical protein
VRYSLQPQPWRKSNHRASDIPKGLHMKDVPGHREFLILRHFRKIKNLWACSGVCWLMKGMNRNGHFDERLIEQPLKDFSLQSK